MPKKSWKEMVSQLPYPLTTVHLNEMVEATALLVNRENAPTLVYLDGNNGNDHILLDSQALEACGKDTEKLFAKINACLPK